MAASTPWWAPSPASSGPPPVPAWCAPTTPWPPTWPGPTGPPPTAPPPAPTTGWSTSRRAGRVPASRWSTKGRAWRACGCPSPVPTTPATPAPPRWRDFADAFVDADVLVVTDVYAAGEPPRPGVSGLLIVNAVLDAHPSARVAYMPTRADVAAYLGPRLAPGDLCLTLGAGDLTVLADELLEGDPPSPALVAR